MSQFKKPSFGKKNRWSEGRKDFERPNKFGGGRPSEFKRDRFNNDRSQSQKFSAVCADCGKRFDLPFRPTGDRPVYCNDCFHKKNDFGPRDFSRRDDNKPSFSKPFQPQPKQDDKRLDEIKSKLDSLTDKVVRLLQLMEKPVETAVAPVAPKIIDKPKAKKVAPKKKVSAKKK